MDESEDGFFEEQLYLNDQEMDDQCEHYNDNMELIPNVQFGLNNIRDMLYQRSPNHANRIGNAGEHYNDNMEQNPNVQFGVNNNNIRDVQYQRSPNLANRIGNIGSSSRELTTSYERHLLGYGTRPVVNTTSLSRGTMGNQKNVLGQSIDGTRPVVRSSLGTMSNEKDVLGKGRTPLGLNLAISSLGIGQSIDGCRPIVNSASSSLETGQGIDGCQPMVNSAGSSLETGQGIDGSRPVGINSASSSLETGQGIDGAQPVVNVARSSLGPGRGIDGSVGNSESSSLGTRVDRIVVPDQSDIRTQSMNRMNTLARMYSSASPTLRAAVRRRFSSLRVNQVMVSTQLDNNMSYPLPPCVPRTRPRPYMHAITRGPPLAMMVPPRAEMHPPSVMIAPPTDSACTSVVRMVPPMVQMESQRDFVRGPASRSTNINTGSYSDEAICQRIRSQDDELGSSSRDAKRLKR